MQTKHIQR